MDFPAIKKIPDDNRWKGGWTVERDRTGTTAGEAASSPKISGARLGHDGMEREAARMRYRPPRFISLCLDVADLGYCKPTDQ